MIRFLVSLFTLMALGACSSSPAPIEGGENHRLAQALFISNAPQPVFLGRVAEGPNSRFSALPIEAVEIYQVDLPLGLISFPIRLIPASPDADCVVYYHGGHGDILDGISTEVRGASYSPILAQILERGCEIFLFQMPHGGNGTGSTNPNPPLLESPDGYVVDLRDWPLHSGFGQLPQEVQNTALGSFVLPVASINAELATREDPPRVGMFGLSGGGWTTAIAAATIPNFEWAVSVAGTDPQESFAYDWEQSHPTLREFGYEAIYAGAVNLGTHFFHVYNHDDPCCFRPAGKNLEEMSERVGEFTTGQAEGSYTVIVDKSGVGHSIRPETQALVLGLVDTLLNY